MRYLLWLTFLIVVAGCQQPGSDAPMTTRSSAAPGATLTVVHVGAPGAPPCVAMEPAVHEFEAAWKTRVNFVNINADQHSTPEYTQYRDLLANVGAIPYTAWIDQHGKVVADRTGYVDAQELATVTETHLK